MPKSALVFVALLSLVACGDDAPAAEPAAAPDPEPEPEPAPEPAPATDTSEACAEVVVVAFAGAAHADDTITRSRDEASARAAELRTRLSAPSADFAAIARTDSDARSSRERGGLVGTYTRDDWPEPHAAIRDAVFALGVGELSEPLEAPYGFVLARRCAVEKIHTRHILVRYSGARNAETDVARSQDAARTVAAEIRAAVVAPGADFAAIARERSEDSSAERGGDVGELGRGRLAPEYEAAAFALAPGDVSEPVRTEFGWHVIQRMP